QSLIPTSAKNPFVALRRFYLGSQALAKLTQRLHPGQIHAQLLQTSIGQMQMRVVKSGHDKVSAEIDNLRLRPLQLLDIDILAHRQNALSAHRNRLLAKSRTEHLIRRHAGINIRVDEDHVGLGLGLRSCGSNVLSESLTAVEDGNAHQQNEGPVTK